MVCCASYFLFFFIIILFYITISFLKERSVSKINEYMYGKSDKVEEAIMVAIVMFKDPDV